jgi:AcrR family transcriptional regulator
VIQLVAIADPKSVDPRLRRRDAKRAEILAAAWELAEKNGLGSISLRDLADLVDLRQPSLYVYFESKLDLYDAMFADGNRQLLATVAQHTPTGEPRKALADFVRVLVRFAAANIVRHQLLFQRTIPGFEPSAESYRLALEFYEIGRLRLAAAGVTAQSDIDFFTAIVSGLAHQQVANDPGGERWVRQAGRAIEMFLADVDRRRRTRSHKGES